MYRVGICEHYNHDICIRLGYVNTIIMISVERWDKWTLQLWYLYKAGTCEHYNHDICMGHGYVNTTIMISLQGWDMWTL
jgi:hypothetical protein